MMNLHEVQRSLEKSPGSLELCPTGQPYLLQPSSDKGARYARVTQWRNTSMNKLKLKHLIGMLADAY